MGFAKLVQMGELQQQPMTIFALRLRIAIFLAGTVLLPGMTLRVEAAATVGILGDSISAGNGSAFGEFPNWHTQLSNAGQFQVELNAAAGGATTGNLVAQRAGIISLVGANQLDYSVLIMGGNDFASFGGFNIATGGNPLPLVNSVVSNIQNTIMAIAASGNVRQIVANVPDVTTSPLVQNNASSFGVTPLGLLALSNAIATANAQIEVFAISQSVPVLDLFGLSQDLAANVPLQLAGVNFNMIFAPDDFHPAPVVHGLLANLFISAAQLGYGDTMLPLSDQTIVTNVSGTPLLAGPTYYDVSAYVLIPEPQTFTLALTAVALCFVRKRRYQFSSATVVGR